MKTARRSSVVVLLLQTNIIKRQDFLDFFIVFGQINDVFFKFYCKIKQLKPRLSK